MWGYGLRDTIPPIFLVGFFGGGLMIPIPIKAFKGAISIALSIYSCRSLRRFGSFDFEYQSPIRFLISSSDKLFISYLYEHREISSNKGYFFKGVEIIKMVIFLGKFIKYNED